jgi:F0F1-type ATP synthase assembly protein I
LTPEPRDERDGSSGAPDQGRADWTRALREAAPLLGLGSTLAASVLLGLGAGYWLDGKLGTKPWLFLLGGAFGMLAAFVQFYKMVVSRKR